MTKDQHKQLILWACKCVESVMIQTLGSIDERLTSAINIANEWALDNVSVGEARKASIEVIAVARGFTNPIEIAVARSIGHAVATAHMADHSLRAAEYAIKAIKLANLPIDIEREFQDKQLSLNIKELVLSARNK